MSRASATHCNQARVDGPSRSFALGAIEANLTSLIDTIGTRLDDTNDTVSIDLYTTVLDDLEQHRWFVRAQL